MFFDGAEQKQTRSITGNTAYNHNYGIYTGNVGSGSHNVKVQYRTPASVTYISSGSDWQGLSLNILTFQLKVCSAGSYVSNDDCVECSPGYYSETESYSDSCDPCAVGYYSDTNGATSCELCEHGYSSLAGSDVCFPYTVFAILPEQLDVSMISNNNWQKWPGLEKTILMQETQKVLVNYQVSFSAGESHVLSRLLINGEEKVGCRSIVGNTVYGHLVSIYVDELISGTYTFKVQYRTPSGSASVDVDGSDWQTQP
eukprot:UN30972